MYIPPSNSPGSATTVRDFEDPLPSFQSPTKREGREITQRNIANAEGNIRYLGLHLVGTPSEVVVISNSIAESVHGSVQRNSLGTPKTQKVGFVVESRAVSEPATGTRWDHSRHSNCT